MKIRTAVLTIAAIIAALCLATPQRAKDKPVSDYPSHVKQYVWIGAYTGKPDDIPAGVVVIGYDPNTNNLVIFESGGDERTIPSAALTGVEQLQVGSLLMADALGNLGTYRAGVATDVNPLYSAGSTPITFPSQDESTIERGAALQVIDIFDTVAVDGTTARKIYQAGFAKTPFLLAEHVFFDLNSTSAQNIYTPPGSLDLEIVVDWAEVRDPTLSLNDGGTVAWSGGFNAGADDVFTGAKPIGVTGAGFAKKFYPNQDGFAIGPTDGGFKMKLSAAYGSGSARVDLWGHFRRQ